MDWSVVDWAVCDEILLVSLKICSVCSSPRRISSVAMIRLGVVGPRLPPPYPLWGKPKHIAYMNLFGDLKKASTDSLMILPLWQHFMCLVISAGIRQSIWWADHLRQTDTTQRRACHWFSLDACGGMAYCECCILRKACKCLIEFLCHHGKHKF